jgi:hypothetical protein
MPGGPKAVQKATVGLALRNHDGKGGAAGE